MTPTLALLLCSAIVLLYLVMERRQFPDMTRALWLPTLWLLYTASKPLAVWFRRAAAADPEAGSPADRAFLLVLLVLAVAILVRRKYDWKTVLRDNKWLTAMFLFSFISIIWSPIIFTSFKRWSRELAALLMAFIIASEPSPRRAMECIVRRTTYILVPFSFLLIKYFPYYGRQYGRYSGTEMWVGMATQKNGLGRLCMLSVFFLIWSLVRRRQGAERNEGKNRDLLEILMLLLSLYLLRGPGGAYSATAIASLALGLLVYGLLQILRKGGRIISLKIVTVAAALLIFFGAATLFIGGTNLKFAVTSLGRDQTLTGRTEIWATLLPLAMTHPLLGHGFGGFYTQKLRREVITEGHNGYLDIILNTGFIGLFLTMGFFLSSCRRAHEEMSRDYDWGVLWLCLIVMVLAHNYAEASIDTFTIHLTALVLFMNVSAVGSRAPKQD